MNGASNRLVDIEDLTEEELEKNQEVLYKTGSFWPLKRKMMGASHTPWSEAENMHEFSNLKRKTGKLMEQLV